MEGTDLRRQYASLWLEISPEDICNKKGLLDMKQRRTATGYLHISAILAWSAIFVCIGAISLHTVRSLNAETFTKA